MLVGPCKTPLPARPRKVLGGHTGTPVHDLNQRVAESAPPTAFQLLPVLAGALSPALLISLSTTAAGLACPWWRSALPSAS